MSEQTTQTIDRLRKARSRRNSAHARKCLLLGGLAAIAFGLTLMLGEPFVDPVEGVRILTGGHVESGSAFVVETLRLPRAVLSTFAGMSFGLGGVAFQVMLRNPLASPDIIGISAGASTAAVFGITVLGVAGTGLSALAIAMGLAVALAIYLLSYTDGVAGARLILIGIAIAAMLQSATSYMLNQAFVGDLQEAFRWLSGTVNGATWTQVRPVALALALCSPILLASARDIDTMRLGDDMSAALGVRNARARLIVILAAVGLIAVATSATGPIAFVAFLSGPIAIRIVGRRGSLLVPGALVGATLVLAADLVGQFALPSRYPVGIVTGAVGAPYLIYLIARPTRRHMST